MNIFKKIQKSRGNCIAGTKVSNIKKVETIAKLFGLTDESNIYKNIERSEAIELLKVVLHKDMAYGAKIMSAEKAKNLTNEFIAEFSDSASYFTNGDFGKNKSNGISWTPATNATFDTGLIVISNGIVGCIWFADED